MRAFHIFICIALITMLVWMTYSGVVADSPTYGGLSWIGWISLTSLALIASIVFVFDEWVRSYIFFRRGGSADAGAPTVRTLTGAELSELGLDKYRGPAYPHPVIFPDRCIGCQACVDACPHDVLDIVDGTAVAVAPDLCMEDTSCQAECPVNPKACIVINTARKVVSRPSPTRDGSSYQSNVAGCYIVGDVSGVPLIKNAVKEGYEVIEHVASSLENAAASDAEYDVAIIGIGPAGASAATAAQEKGLRYVAIEQDRTLSTIEAYPKGKYIFFKPDAKDWSGGLPVSGLGLTDTKYSSATGERDSARFEMIDRELEDVIAQQSALVLGYLLPKIPVTVRSELSPLLGKKVDAEVRRRIHSFLRTKSSRDPAAAYRSDFLPRKDELLNTFSREVVTQLTGRVPGDQRENILNVWLNALKEKAVKVNEFESCVSVTRAEHADYFVVETERRDDKSKQIYRARRVVLAIGLRGLPNRLRLPNEDMQVSIDGRVQPKVVYSLTDPQAYRGRRIVIVGGGNVAVEAAVDLVATRVGSDIRPRSPGDMNEVTVLVRASLAPTVKFANKFQLYQCADNGILNLRFGVGIKEMREREIVLEDVLAGTELETIPNDLVFALIGGERPDRFLQSMGITLS
jgi:thioredoxin reductase